MRVAGAVRSEIGEGTDSAWVRKSWSEVGVLVVSDARLKKRRNARNERESVKLAIVLSE